MNSRVFIVAMFLVLLRILESTDSLSPGYGVVLIYSSSLDIISYETLLFIFITCAVDSRLNMSIDTFILIFELVNGDLSLITSVKEDCWFNVWTELW